LRGKRVINILDHHRANVDFGGPEADLFKVLVQIGIRICLDDVLHLAEHDKRFVDHHRVAQFGDVAGEEFKSLEVGIFVQTFENLQCRGILDHIMVRVLVQVCIDFLCVEFLLCDLILGEQSLTLNVDHLGWIGQVKGHSVVALMLVDDELNRQHCEEVSTRVESLLEPRKQNAVLLAKPQQISFVLTIARREPE
jgi:hypothetical protein